MEHCFRWIWGYVDFIIIIKVLHVKQMSGMTFSSLSRDNLEGNTMNILLCFIIEEGREGARTKGLQKSNLRYRGRLTTPRNHPHTSTDNERPGVCEFARAHLVRTWFFTQLWCRM